MRIRLTPYHNGWNVVHSSIIEDYRVEKNIAQTWVLSYKLRDVEFILIEEIPLDLKRNSAFVKLHAFAGEYFYELHEEEFELIESDYHEKSVADVYLRVHTLFDKFLEMSDDELMNMIMEENL